MARMIPPSMRGTLDEVEQRAAARVEQRRQRAQRLADALGMATFGPPESLTDYLLARLDDAGLRLDEAV